MRLTASVLTLTLLLAGCVTVPTKAVVCGPRLPDPPASIVDGLEASARADPSAAAWVIGLDKHYRKQDACAKR